MAEVLRELDLTLTAYSLAPCWDDEQPYYGLFVERGDLPDAAAGERLAARLDARLREANIEYAAKRESLRLGPLRLELLRDRLLAAVGPRTAAAHRRHAGAVQASVSDRRPGFRGDRERLGAA